MMNDPYGWIQLVLFVGLVAVLTKPVGLYLVRVLDPAAGTFLDPVLKPLERLLYRILSVDPAKEQGWGRYGLCLLLFSMTGLLFTYAILRLQHLLPLNPQGFGPLSPDLAFNTAASFTTNTNWQSYSGEATLSYFSQMVWLAFHNFVSAATGIAVAAALTRGIARRTAATVGNFWTDLVRVNLYLLLPFCLVYALFLISQGAIQNFKPYETARLVEPYTVRTPQQDSAGKPVLDAAGRPALAEQKVETQSIAQGPLASQAAIKMLGTNGGGFMNANAAHPYENPTPLANFIQILSIFLIPSGLTWHFGRTVGNCRHGWTIWGAMAVLFLAGVLVCWQAEAAGNPRLIALGLDPAAGNMEGKEVRFGVFASALFEIGRASCRERVLRNV
jgi:potassium-transporting ATPase potassium-binding subunit